MSDYSENSDIHARSVPPCKLPTVPVFSDIPLGIMKLFHKSDTLEHTVYTLFLLAPITFLRAELQFF